jgi:hypothetical protein
MDRAWIEARGHRALEPSRLLWLDAHLLHEFRPPSALDVDKRGGLIGRHHVELEALVDESLARIRLCERFGERGAEAAENGCGRSGIRAQALP